MTTPAGASPAMTPERWRVVDAILKAALAWEPAERVAFVADACGDDEELRREVASLLAAHDEADEFLELPAVEALGAVTQRAPLIERLGEALAGRYAIEREVGQGGMATVYLARDLRHDRRVAIKVLREELARAIGADRFLAEIRVTASLQHPHILPLFDSGSDGDLLWYVMPYVEGETLRARLTRDGRLGADEAVRIAREMADALEHAHARGVVHRDVKPENVLLQGGHALVADFGVALALEHAGGERLTRTGIAIGTPQYMAPEQAAGERAIDGRADVYALGAVLREMLAGDSRVATRSRSAARPRPDARPSLDAAVQRALAPRPDDRFPSAAAFATALALPDESPDTRADSAGSASRRVRMVTARAAIYTALLALVIGLGGGWALARSSPMQPGPAVAPADSPSPDRKLSQWPAESDGTVLTVVDRTGREQRAIAANRPWTPRISPDGRRVAYGAFGEGRNTSDVWVMDLSSGATQRVTNDGDDSNDPQWSPDGRTLAYSASAPGGKDVLMRRLDGEASVLASRRGTQWASDWLRDGSALLVTDESGSTGRDIIVQPANGSAARAYAATRASETAARISPDGRWVAYTSNESGRDEVYLDAYPQPGKRVTVSLGGGVHPVWRGDGRELYYWNDDALTAVQIGSSWGGAPPSLGTRTVLFRTPYAGGPNTMYDASPDGQRFVIVRER
jgi:serine/threonine protein kinase